jgi:hypothetical protein
MKTLFKLIFAFAVLVTMLGLLGGFAAWHGVHHGADWHVSINGDELDMASDLGDWLGAGLGIGIATLVCLIVVPLALLIGVAVPLLIVGGVLAAMVVSLLGVGAVLGSPVIVIGLVLYFALRNRNRQRGATNATAR